MIIDDTALPGDANQIFALKKIFPTNFTTEELRELAALVRNQSFYSAQTADKYLLQKYYKAIGGILNPVPKPGEATTQFNAAYVRTAIKDYLKQSGYQPAEEDTGTLKDLSSDPRINLIINTNAQLAQGQGWWMSGQDSDVLNRFPGQELFRLESRVQPRAWLFRWKLAGAQTGDPIGTGWTITTDGRMIALKNHAIWHWIGSSALFKDALDVVWPPFAFGSGMWVRDIDREETESLGLLKRGAPAPKPMNIVDALKAFDEKISQLMEAA